MKDDLDINRFSTHSEEVAPFSMKLDNREEFIGTLHKVERDYMKMELHLRTEHIIRIPRNTFTFEQLEEYVNHKIGLVRINNQYRIRKVDE